MGAGTRHLPVLPREMARGTRHSYRMSKRCAPPLSFPLGRARFLFFRELHLCLSAKSCNTITAFSLVPLAVVLVQVANVRIEAFTTTLLQARCLFFFFLHFTFWLIFKRSFFFFSPPSSFFFFLNTLLLLFAHFTSHFRLSLFLFFFFSAWTLSAFLLFFCWGWRWCSPATRLMCVCVCVCVCLYVHAS